MSISGIQLQSSTAIPTVGIRKEFLFDWAIKRANIPIQIPMQLFGIPIFMRIFCCYKNFIILTEIYQAKNQDMSNIVNYNTFYLKI